VASARKPRRHGSRFIGYKSSDLASPALPAAKKSWQKKAAPFLAFLVMVAFWPGMLGAGLTLRWAVLWVGLPILTVPPRMTAIGWIGASFLAFGAVSLAWSPFRYDGVY
jgi:hypothetical protein